MKRAIFSVSISILFLIRLSNAQELSFDFDVAGNQTMRTWLCPGCLISELTLLRQDRISYVPSIRDTLLEGSSIPLLLPSYIGENLNPIFSRVTDTLYHEEAYTSVQEQSATTFSATLDAGRIAAALDVSASGAATFSVPFTLPPGINGVVPSVGLQYNSQGGNGIAGYGWNLTGLSSITRVPAVPYIDDRIGTVNFDLQDRFALDGQRLLLKSGTYGGDGAEYQTETYSNLKIISWGVSPYGASYGPAYFEVRYPDGSRSYYGYSSGARSQTTYAIEFSENTQQVRVNYFYNLIDNQLYISQIDYGSLAGTSNINKILFSYDSPSRRELSYIGGLALAQNRILSKVSIYADDVAFRHYVPSYNVVSGLYYQTLTSLTELNGTETRMLSPITFSYDLTGNITTKQAVSTVGPTGANSLNAGVVTADFTGDGSVDFLMYFDTKDALYAYYDIDLGSSSNIGLTVPIGPFKEVFPVKLLTHNDKLFTKQGIAVVRENGTNKYKFDTYASTAYAPALFQYERLWDDVPKIPGYYDECHGEPEYVEGPDQTFEFVSGDFNGDGLTDIMAIGYNQSITTHRARDEFGICVRTFGESGSHVYFINLDRRITANFILDVGQITASLGGQDRIYTADFNGDGKTDIINIGIGKMEVYSLNDDNTSLELLWSTTDSRIRRDAHHILLGDYNGDGKMDIMFSTGLNSVFTTFLSSGKGFVKSERSQTFSTQNNSGDGNGFYQYFLIPNDINGDGKTDIIAARILTTNSSSTGHIQITPHHNVGINSALEPIYNVGSVQGWIGNVAHYPIPFFLSADKHNPMQQFGFLSSNHIELFKFSKDMGREKEMVTIQQDGLSHQLNYSDLLSGSFPYDIPLYDTDYSQLFPYIDVENAPGFRVVSRLKRTFGSEVVQKVFGYAKAVLNADGLGFLGFSELISSNWHLSTLDPNRTFQISFHNPQLRGALINQFTAKTPYIDGVFKNITLSNPPPSGGIADGATLSNYISRQDLAYTTTILPNKTFINIPVATAQKDLLTNTFSTTALLHDAFYNVTKTTENINSFASRVTDITYANNTGSSYYIGRPLTHNITTTQGSETFSTEEHFTYTDYLPTFIQRKGHGTPFISESLSYDPYGNVTSRTTTVPGGATRSESMAYDPTGRFMIQQTDPDGLVSQWTYNNQTGNVLSSTDPYGRTTSYGYDSWGRQTAVTDYLSNTSTTVYSRSGTNTIITNLAADGGSSITTINALGQQIEIREKAVTGAFIGQARQYDVYGRQSGISAPSTTGTYSQWDTYLYDVYGRNNQINFYTGQTTTYSYTGLSTTMNDGTKSVITVLDALGRTSSVTDPGGTVNYSYFANGNLKSADFGGSLQTIEQNGWGEKTKLTDPSAGIYTYSYDGWGQLLEESTPKGVTTYTYDAAGKLTAKTLIGSGTNMAWTYAYHSTTKLPSLTTLVNADGNNSTYTYVYDTYKRLSSTTEDNPFATFTTTYTYDGYGRISLRDQSATDKNSSITMNKGVIMTYQNGQLLQMTLDGGGQLLWKAETLNSRGMLASFKQGSSLLTSLTPDSYGYPMTTTISRVSPNPATLMTLGYTFNASRGFPTARSNSAFGWNETFGFDNLDRLTIFNDNDGNHSQAYDGRGRISSNTRLGSYNYSGTSYQQSGLDLNTTADLYYQGRTEQSVSYTAFKSPVEIHEPGHERYGFQYNANLDRANMFYGSFAPDQLLRPLRKHYSADGGVEISKDLTIGKTSFVFYLGGDAYSAPAIWKETYSASPTTQQLFYLHRDYLGSIVLITNTDGQTVEKRQFDAWGRLVRLQDGSNNNLSNFTVIDRGFTGHEHLLPVGLIHMNARLYDPLLGRFLAPDNYIQDPYGTQNFNRYGYAMNNPLVYVDQNGEFLIGALVGVGVGILANGVSNLIQGKAFFKNWIMAGVMGGIGGSFAALSAPGTLFSATATKGFVTTYSVTLPATGGQQALASAISVASSYLPGIDIPIGNNFSIGLSPALFIGTGGLGVGANVSANFRSENVDFGLSFGATAWNKHLFTGGNFLETRFGAQMAIGNENVKIGLANSTFGGGGISQTTGSILAYGKNWGLRYENDFQFGLGGDDGDRWRTTGLSLNYKDWTLAMHFATGDPGPSGNRESVDGTHYTRELNPYRLGSATLGYRGTFAGWNSERIRHIGQNRFAHDIIQGGQAKHFRMLPSAPYQGFYYGYRRSNIFTTW